MFPAHKSTLLQPLENFHIFLSPAFNLSFCRSNIINAFRKQAIPEEAVAWSLLTIKTASLEQVVVDELEPVEANDQNQIFSLPASPVSTDDPAKRNP